MNGLDVYLQFERFLNEPILAVKLLELAKKSILSFDEPLLLAEEAKIG